VRLRLSNLSIPNLMGYTVNRSRLFGFCSLGIVRSSWFNLIVVCAVQSYNLAQILLALYAPGIPPGIAALQYLRRMEAQVESYAREICGISLTNANVSARINAVEPLRTCLAFFGAELIEGGRCLPATAQRESVVNLLRSIQLEHSWPCDSVIASWNGFGFLFDT